MKILETKNYNTLSIDVSRDLQLARVFGVIGNTKAIALMKENHIVDFFVGYQDEDKLIKAYQSIEG